MIKLMRQVKMNTEVRNRHQKCECTSAEDSLGVGSEENRNCSCTNTARGVHQNPQPVFLGVETEKA